LIENNLIKVFDSFKLINFSKIQIDCLCDGVKALFFANGWEALKERSVLLNSIRIAASPLLLEIKINKLFLRARYRDYY